MGSSIQKLNLACNIKIFAKNHYIANSFAEALYLGNIYMQINSCSVSGGLQIWQDPEKNLKEQMSVMIQVAEYGRQVFKYCLRRAKDV